MNFDGQIISHTDYRTQGLFTFEVNNQQTCRQLLTWVTNDLSNGAAPTRFALSSNSGVVDLSPFE